MFLAVTASNVNPRTVRIVVLGPSIPFASFTFSPTSAAVLDPVTFDANGSSLDGWPLRQLLQLQLEL